MTIHPAVLLVTNDPESDKIIRLNLSLKYYDVLTVAHVGEAVEQVSSSDCDIDLVLLDVTVPASEMQAELAGCEELRRMSELPIVVLSTSTRESDRQRVICAGASGYVSKPFESRELIDEIERLLGQPGADELAPAAS
jgi:DNA-binding response OmpR family regulator